MKSDIFSSNRQVEPVELIKSYYGVDNIDILGKYVKEKIDETNGNRNWLNARAALNKFDEFKTNSNVSSSKPLSGSIISGQEFKDNPIDFEKLKEHNDDAAAFFRQYV